MKGAVGVIYGRTGSTEFNFALYMPNSVRRTDYVKVWHDVEGWVLAQVVEIEAVGNSLSKLEKDEKQEEKYLAKAIVIGIKDDSGLLKTPKTPFSPGEKVFIADKKLISSTLGLEKGDAFIGLLEDHDVEVRLDVNSLVQKHCCILAKTGSGKSYSAGVIIEELLEKNVPLIIIDPHGEYGAMKHSNDSAEELEAMKRYGIEPHGYEEKIKIYVPPGSPFMDSADGILTLDGRNLSAGELIKLLGMENSPAQSSILYQGVKSAKKRGDYTISDIIEEVEYIKSNTKWSVIGSLEQLEESGLFSSTPTPVEDLLQEGKASVIDMRGVNPEIQDLIVSRICREIFELRKVNQVPPGMIVVEEAHNFCPERGYGKASSTAVLRTIASEGRKFGLGLMIISQRPARVDKNVISQCNTQIILRVTNPNDLQAIKKGVEGLTGEMVEEIRRLPPGTALIVSTDIERPIIVDVRIRKSKHGGSSVDVVEREEDKAIAKKKMSGRIFEERRTEKTVNKKLSKDGKQKTIRKEKGESLFRKIFGGS